MSAWIHMDQTEISFLNSSQQKTILINGWKRSINRSVWKIWMFGEFFSTNISFSYSLWTCNSLKLIFQAVWLKWLSVRDLHPTFRFSSSLYITVLYRCGVWRCVYQPSARIVHEYCRGLSTLNGLYTPWILTCMREVMCALCAFTVGPLIYN